MELRNWTDEPRGPDGKWAGGGHVATTAAEAKWIAEGELAWKKHQEAKEAGKPSLATYYKKKASAAHAKLHGAASPEEAFKKDSASPTAKAPKPEDAIDSIHASLLQKHEEAKAAKKGSLATYYKKKAAAYAAAHGNTSHEAPKVATTHEDVAGTDLASKAAEATAAKNKLLDELQAESVAKPIKTSDELPKSFEGMQVVQGPHGSMPGAWYKDPATGKTYYVKASKDAANEVASAKVYEALGLKPGVDIPKTGISNSGRVVSEKINGLTKNSAATWSNSNWAHTDQAKKMFAAAVLTSHYDAAGSEQDNTLWNPSTGKAAIVDLGGAMGRRAQGGVKPTWSTGQPLAAEVAAISGHGTKSNPNLTALFGGMTNDEKAQALLDAKQALMKPGAMTSLGAQFKELGMPLQERNQAISVLTSRISEIDKVAASLTGKPSSPIKPQPHKTLDDVLKESYAANKPADNPVVADLKTKYINAKGSLKNYYKKKLQAAGAWDDSLAGQKSSDSVPKVSAPNVVKVPGGGYATDHGGTTPAVSKPTLGFMGHHVPATSAASTREFVNAHAGEEGKSEGVAGLDHSNIDVRNVQMTTATKQAITSYTGNKYRETNDALRGNSAMSPAIRNRIKGIDAAFAAAPETDHAIQLWRHTGNPHTFDGLKPGDVYSDAGVQSTTTTRAAFGGGMNRTTLKIVVPKGSQVLWVRPFSHVKSENEAILPRGQKYVVLREVQDDTFMGHPRRVLEVMAIPDKAMPGVNTKGAPEDRPYQHNLRMKLLRMAAEARRELRNQEMSA